MTTARRRVERLERAMLRPAEPCPGAGRLRLVVEGESAGPEPTPDCGRCGRTGAEIDAGACPLGLVPREVLIVVTPEPTQSHA